MCACICVPMCTQRLKEHIVSVLLYHTPPCSFETVSLSLELGWEWSVAPNSIFLNAGVTGVCVAALALPWDLNSGTRAYPSALSTGGNISQPQGTFSIQPPTHAKHKLTRESQRPLLRLLGCGGKERSVGIPALDSNLGMEEGSTGKGGAVVLPSLPFQVLGSVEWEG